MPPACNIDARGKRVRLLFGIALLVVGLALLFAWALPYRSLAGWIVTAVCLLAAGFAVYEARAGWCAFRAMGFKTPI